MKNRIVGVIGVLWGGAIVGRWLLTDSSTMGSSAYQGGQSAAALFGVLMLMAGLYYFFKKTA